MKLREQILNRLSALAHSSASIIFGEDFWGAQLLAKFAKMKGVKIMVDEYIPRANSPKEAQENYKKSRKARLDFETEHAEEISRLRSQSDSGEIIQVNGMWTEYYKLLDEERLDLKDLLWWQNISVY